MPVYLITKPVQQYSPWYSQPVLWELEAVFPTLGAALDAEDRARDRKYAIQLRSSSDFPGIDPTPYLAATDTYHIFTMANPHAPVAEIAVFIDEACSRLWELQIALHPLLNPVASHIHN